MSEPGPKKSQSKAEEGAEFNKAKAANSKRSDAGASVEEPRQKNPQFRAMRGVRDILPPETALWNRVEQTARDVFTTFGFGEIRLPIFETTELFARSVGEDTDIVSKEMFTFPLGYDPDSLSDTAAGKTVTLRPEATASVCRAYIEHGMNSLPQPVKLYYWGPMFRRERPQKGRHRQFFQIGAEVLGGNDAPGIDAEVIDMVMTFFDKLELQGLELDINSIGCRECRAKYVEVLRDALLQVKDKLGPDSQRRIDTNPLRVLDSKLENEQEIIATLPRMAAHLCPDCAEHFAEVKRQLELRGVIYRENWRLVRGLDYYMRTTFEITAQGLGSQNAVCGGGRYDGLVELLGGPPAKGIGFAIGEDRLILSLQESGKAPAPKGPDIYIAWMGEKAFATGIRAAKDLRSAGYRVELPATEQKFGKALGQADKLGSRYALILGEDEVTTGEWTLKTLADGSQKKYTENDLLEYLRETTSAVRQQL